MPSQPLAEEIIKAPEAYTKICTTYKHIAFINVNVIPPYRTLEGIAAMYGIPTDQKDPEEIVDLIADAVTKVYPAIVGKDKRSIFSAYIKIIIDKYFPLAEGDKVLDIGSFVGTSAYYMISKGCQVVMVEPNESACDIMDAALRKCSNIQSGSWEIVKGFIPIELAKMYHKIDSGRHESFDVITAFNAFEHINDELYLDSLVLFRELLKFGGKLYIFAPDGYSEEMKLNTVGKKYATRLAEWDHFAVKSMEYYVVTARAAGFRLVRKLFVDRKQYTRIVMILEKI